MATVIPAEQTPSTEAEAEPLDDHEAKQGDQDNRKRSTTAIEIKEMKQRSKFSLAWSIADNRCYMVLLQICVIVLCVFSLLISYSQYGMKNVTKCDTDSQFLGPYLGESSDGTTFGCPWPRINSIIRFFPPGIGLISGIITIILQVCLGKKVLLDMDSFNQTRGGDEKIEYFDIYSNCYFRFVRKVIGFAGYLQFISFGLDLRSFLGGREYGTSQLHISPDKGDLFESVLYIALPVAILLRLTHDAMYQRLFKRNFGLELKFDWNSDKDYQGTTVKEKHADAGGIALTVNEDD